MGVEGFNRWSFINRGDLDGHWQMIDTWDPATKTLLKSFPPKPNAYFVYGLISRLTAKHSTLVATEVGGRPDRRDKPRVCRGAPQPESPMYWIIVNDAPRAWPARLRVSGANRSRLHQYQVTFQQKDNLSLKIAPAFKARLKAGEAVFSDELPAMSLTIYSTYDLGARDKGIIAE